MRQLLISLSQGFVTEEMARTLRGKLNGPSSLLRALDRLADSVADVSDRTDVLKALQTDLKRISRVRIASFVHPNEKGARRYSEAIVERYVERSRHIHFADDFVKLHRSLGAPIRLGVRETLHRYGLPHLGSLRGISQLLLVDSIALKLVMSQQSDTDVYDDIFLDLGTGLRWRLNFPYTQDFSGGIPQAPRARTMLHRHFAPGASDLFTVDAGGTHLANLTQFVLESKATAFSKGTLRPREVTLFVNGIEAFSAPVVFR